MNKYSLFARVCGEATPEGINHPNFCEATINSESELVTFVFADSEWNDFFETTVNVSKEECSILEENVDEFWKFAEVFAKSA